MGYNSNQYVHSDLWKKFWLNADKLANAAREGTPEDCERLIKEGWNIESKNENGLTPLMISTKNPNPDVFRVLLKNGADLNALDDNRQGVLNHAIANSCLEIVKEVSRLTKANLKINNDEIFINNQREMLFKAMLAANEKKYGSMSDLGVNPNELQEGRIPYIYLAAENKDLRVLDYLEENGCDLSRGYEEENVFTHAIECNSNPDIIDYLLKKNLLPKDVFTVGKRLIKNPNVEVWKRLFKHGFPKNNYPFLYTLLATNDNPNPEIIELLADKDSIKTKTETSNICHLAAGKNDPIYLKILKKAGVNLNEKNIYNITPLMSACAKTSNTAVIDYLIKNGGDIKERDSQGCDSLIWTMANPNLNITKHLVKLGADVHTKTGDNKENILMLALRRGANYEKIEYILSLGIDVNEMSGNQYPAICFAAQYNPYVDVLELLVQKGADIKFSPAHDKNANLLFCAAENTNEEIIDYLINKGLDVNAVSKEGRTPLLVSAVNSNLSVFAKLLEKGADINVLDNNKCNLLHVAAEFNDNPALVDFLLKTGRFGLYDRDVLGRSPILAATHNKNIDVIKYFIALGGNIKDKDNSGCTALMYALMYADEDNEKNLEMAKFLIEQGVEINNKDSGDISALMMACSKITDPAYIEMLINAGADLNYVGSEGTDCLMGAVRNNPNPEIIKLLINKGLSVRKKYNKGKNLAHFAAENPNPQIMQTLIDNGVAFDSEDDFERNTPLDIAAWHGSPEVCEVLIKAGSRLEHKDSDGCTPLLLSTKNRNPEVFRLLLKYGANIKAKDYMKHGIVHYAVGCASLELVKEIVELTKTKFDDSNLNNYVKHKGKYLQLQEECSNRGLPPLKARIEKLPYLYYAAINPDIGVLDYLIGCGCNIFEGYVEENVFTQALSSNPNPNIVSYLFGEKFPDEAIQIAGESICKSPYTEVWKRLFAIGFPFDYQDQNGMSLLMKVLMINDEPNPEVVALLCNEKTVNLKDDMGLTACHHAAQKNDVRYLKILQAAGAKMNEKENLLNRTPLMGACLRTSNPEIISFLIKNGADIKERSLNGEDALFTSISNINFEIALYLIKEFKADIHTKNRNGCNILMEAIRNKSTNLIDAFLKMGIDVNEKDNLGYPAIVSAAYFYPYPFLLELLIQNGADINFKTDKNENLLIFAARNNSNEAVVDYFLNKGFDKNYVTTEGETPILAAAQNPNFMVMEKLIQSGANLNAVNNNKQNVLMVAAQCNTNPNFISSLLEKGFPINSTDESGNTAVFNAALNPNINIIKTLVEKGADVKAVNNNGFTTLMTALSSDCSIDMVKYLIESGVDVNAKSLENITALMIAASSVTDTGIIELLITAGADVNAEDDRGYNAYTAAKEFNQNPAIAETVKKYMVMANYSTSSFNIPSVGEIN